MTDNLPIRIHGKKIENKITFKAKTGYYHELSTPETMILFGSTENKITKDKNSKILSQLEIIEVDLVYWNIVSNDDQHDWTAFHTFIPS